MEENVLKTLKNFKIFDNYIEYNYSIKNLKFLNGDLCDVGGTRDWCKSILIIYNDEFTYQINLIANANGSFVSIRDYDNVGNNIYYKTADLNDKDMFENFINFVTNHCELLIDNYNLVEENMDIYKKFGDSNCIWVKKNNKIYEITMSSSGYVHLYKLVKKDDNAPYEKILIGHYENMKNLLVINKEIHKSCDCCVCS